jgi:hypothetical protein
VVRFDHAFVAPDGTVFAFFGAGENELLLHMRPMAEGGTVLYVSPEMETVVLGGHDVAWLPDERPRRSPRDIFSPGSWTRPPLSDQRPMLVWDAGGVSYALRGRALTREEAVAFFLSLVSPAPSPR